MAELIRSYSLPPTGGIDRFDIRLADLDGDGEIEWLFTQGAAHQAAHCLDGGRIWEYLDPGATAGDLRLDMGFPAVDVDRDGLVELMCGRREAEGLHLCVVDARTGVTRRSAPYPGLDYRTAGAGGSIQVVRLRDTFYPQDILVTWDGGFAAAFDHNLRPLWLFNADGLLDDVRPWLGGTPFAWDIDGDGLDELLFGSALLDHDGRLLMTLPNATGHPGGSVRLQPLAEEGAPRLLTAAGGRCFDTSGEMLWTCENLRYGAALHTGRLIPGAGRQVVIYDAASRVEAGAPDRVIALDGDGRKLWDMPVEPPAGRPGEIGLRTGDWNGDGLDEVFIGSGGETWVLDGAGRKIDVLPGGLLYTFDLLGDRRVEAVIVPALEGKADLEFWTNDALNPHPESNKILGYRRTSTDMYNSARY